MKNVLTAGAALLLSTSIASAGGVERSAPSVALLFEEGNYLELNFGFIAPEVSGTQAIPAGPGSPVGADSGDISEDYSQLSFGYKNDLTDQLALALIIDQPIGADVNYSEDTNYAYGGGVSGLGSTATIDSVGLTALLSYEAAENITVYGGVRAIQTSGEVALFNTYSMSTSTETDYGYVVGAAWERPEIAARVALTYHSEVTHDFTATEASLSPAVPPTDTEFSTTIPQSVTLEGQTGVAADTLLFGSIRWVDWSEFDISPTIFGSGAGNPSLVDYEDDSVTYNLGLGRRFNDDWSGAVTAGYEAANGGFAGNLGPTDGNTSLGVAVTRTIDAVRITGGVRYIWIGDADTEAPLAFTGGTPGVTLGEFEDNTAWAAGLRIAYNF
ncbi:OmpP1/FadL family transporter [Yoonia sp. R2-816]|uniref:OmpP1/FadL family transporter n=1 Tax=Yoonia sp. R2-816 TaxID=3342638 RepID=UPI0037294B30